jgi:hypothetical protein
MNIVFKDEQINARVVKTYPRKFKIGDFLVGPSGELLKVVTVQTDIPMWESSTKTKTVVIFKTAADTLIPVNGLSGTFEILRPKRLS